VHCERYSPLVGLGQAYPQPAFDPDPAFDCLLMDVTSIGALFGGEEKLAEAMQQDFLAQGYQPRIAIADTVAAAWGLAHFSSRSITICERGWPALQALPIAALRLDPAHVATLRELGVEQVKQLAALPHAGLAARFEGLVRQLDRASGAEPELILPVRPPPEFQAEWLLEYPTADRRALEMILEQLALRVGEALRLRDQGAVQLVCRLDVAEQPPRLVQIGLFRPSTDARHFLELLRLQGETLKLRGAIGRVGLAAMVTARLEHRQKQLFAAALDNHSEELALLINRLSNRLGRERVTRPKLTRDAVPEKACELEPLTTSSFGLPPERKRKLAKKAARKIAESSSQAPPPRDYRASTRPLLLLNQPAALEAVSLAPEGPPVSFVWRGERHRIARHWGPERIETAWWRGPSVQRDYYRVETQTGQRYWLFRELRTRKWFLHGSFG
jgi:protein ImuB